MDGPSGQIVIYSGRHKKLKADDLRNGRSCDQEVNDPEGEIGKSKRLYWDGLRCKIFFWTEYFKRDILFKNDFGSLFKMIFTWLNLNLLTLAITTELPWRSAVYILKSLCVWEKSNSKSNIKCPYGMSPYFSTFFILTLLKLNLAIILYN